MGVLLLDASLRPLNAISPRRLVVLLEKDRVSFLDGDTRAQVLASLRDRHLPHGTVIAKLSRSIYTPRRALRPNRRNLLLRDGHTCQYCGHIGVASDMTIDHVTPLSRGGAPDRWENCVVACRRCNWRKGNKRPEEAGMRLRAKPKPLVYEHSHILFMRHPDLKKAYDELLAA
jgi:5-methylcytosine-specific restriction endonuclease McrA